MSRNLASFFVVVLFLSSGCSGGSKVGESCKTSGTTSECQEGAVCTSVTSSSAVCRKLCTADSECEAAETCTALPDTTLKSCQPV